MVAQVLCIGQSDCCAVSGVQADVKTVQALGGYAATVVTAVSARNTQGYRDTQVMPEDIINAQFEAVMDDLSPAVIKTGMLANATIINLVSSYAENQVGRGVKVVVDPVMGSRLGKVILDKEARDALKRSLILHTDVLVPNVAEAEDLTGLTIRDIDDMKHAADMLVTLGPKAVVLRGGDVFSPDNNVIDVVNTDQGLEVCESEGYGGKAFDGIGTALSSAIAASLAQGLNVQEAYQKARTYVNRAMVASVEIGQGFVPLNHAAGFQADGK